MGDIFSGLEDLGLSGLNDVDIYKKEEDKKAVSKEEKKEPEHKEEDFIFDKTFTCPVCDKEFKAKMIRTGKVKLDSTDRDLRPKYLHVDSLKYDAVMCPHCGYSAISRNFGVLSSRKIKIVKEKVASSYKAKENIATTYSYDEAIIRHKMALLCTILTDGKASERAYTCLKIAWLFRGKREALDKKMTNYDKEVIQLAKTELEFIGKAYEGFTAAYSKETFPCCGMDENTVSYLIADLAYTLGKYEESSRNVSHILTMRDASDRLKEKARDLRNLISAKTKQ